MQWLVRAPPADVDLLAANHVSRALVDAIERRGRAVLALPGGSAIESVALALAASTVDWSRVWLTWVDERAVGPG
jgi:6-phosphogluconolactonase